MPENTEVIKVTREWVAKAESDLKTAVYTLKVKDESTADTICYHAQQCAEKYFKAALTNMGRDFPRTHDIGELVALVPVKQRPKLSPEEQRLLTDYAVTMRYPGDYEPVTLSEARIALRLARRVRTVIRKMLPKEVKC